MIFPWFSRDFPRRVIDLIAELARRPGDDALRQPMCFFWGENELGILGEEIS